MLTHTYNKYTDKIMRTQKAPHTPPALPDSSKGTDMKKTVLTLAALAASNLAAGAALADKALRP